MMDHDVRDNRRWTFSLEEALLWIMDSYFSQNQWFDVKNVFMMDLFSGQFHAKVILTMKKKK